MGNFKIHAKFESYQSKYITHLHSMIFHLPFLTKSYPYNPQRPAFKKNPSGIISVTTVRIVMKLRSHNLGMLPHGIQDTVDGRKPASVEVGSLSHHLQCFYKSQVMQDFFHQQNQESQDVCFPHGGSYCVGKILHTLVEGIIPTPVGLPEMGNRC